MDFRRESYTKNDYRELVESLLLMGEEEYRAFNQKLLPGVQGIIGIRLPILRKISKEIAKGNYREYLKSAGTEYYEEIMLCGFVIGEAKMALSERLSFIEGFVLKIQNWGVCDSFCAGLKFVKNEKKSVYSFLNKYRSSEKEFELRFFVVMLMDYFIEKEYLQELFRIFDEIKHEGYYVKMAVAWAISVCYVKFPEETSLYLKHNELDDFTYHKALSKITESNRVSTPEKEKIRSMKRK